MNWQQFGERLHAEGLLATAQLPERAHSDAPWYLAIAPAVGAWFAALFLLSFVGGLIAGIWDAAPMRVVVGALLCAAAARWGHSSAFRSQFGLAISLAGLALIASALFEWRIDWRARMLLAGLLCGALWRLNAEPVHRALMAIGLVLSVVAAAVGWRLEPLVTAAIAALAIGLWVEQTRWAASGRDALFTPVATACVLALLLLQAIDIAPASALLDGLLRTAVGSRSAVRAAILATALAGAGLWMSRKTEARSVRTDVLITFGCAALAVATWRMPGIIAGLLVWLLGTWAGRSLIRGLGLAGSAAYLLTQYYTMSTTLMEKGQSLIITGLLLAVVAGLLRRLYRRVPPDGGTR